MSNDEAKFILRAYRPDGRDAADPLFADALRQAQLDPALGAWFERERARDAVLAAKLAEVPPPAGLRDAILAGARASHRTEPQRRGSVRWWAFAAAAAVVIAALGVWQARTSRLDPLMVLALSDARELTPHGGHGEPATTLRRALTAETTHLARPLPVDFATLAHTGCRSLSLSGATVLEVCFNRDGTWFHCYVVRVGDLSGAARARGPQFASRGPLNAMAWSDGSYRYVVAGPASRATLERLL
jgi:anti-sigma factor RsiW